VEHKFYAAGIGLVLEFDPVERVVASELVSFDRGTGGR
jgi:hypothetical protein